MTAPSIPATATSVPFTITGSCTVSPGLAVTSEMSQLISPAGSVVVVVVVVVVVFVVVVVVVSSTISMKPSTSLIFFVTSRPFSSTTIMSPQVTGYLPALQSSGTVYVSVNTSEPSAALTLNADLVSNAISSSATLYTTLAE